MAFFFPTLDRINRDFSLKNGGIIRNELPEHCFSSSSSYTNHKRHIKKQIVFSNKKAFICLTGESSAYSIKIEWIITILQDNSRYEEIKAKAYQASCKRKQITLDAKEAANPELNQPKHLLKKAKHLAERYSIKPRMAYLELLKTIHIQDYQSKCHFIQR